MKKTSILSTLLAVVLVVGFLFVSCDTPTASKSSNSSSSSSSSSSGFTTELFVGTWKGNAGSSVKDWTITITDASPKIITVTNGSDTLKADLGWVINSNPSSSTNGTYGQGYKVTVYVTSVTGSSFSKNASDSLPSYVTGGLEFYINSGRNQFIVPTISNLIPGITATTTTSDYFKKQ